MKAKGGEAVSVSRAVAGSLVFFAAACGGRPAPSEAPEAPAPASHGAPMPAARGAVEVGLHVKGMSKALKLT